MSFISSTHVVTCVQEKRVPDKEISLPRGDKAF